METGYVVEHCFPGPGKYTVKENIIEKKTGTVVFNKLFYDLEVKNIVQPYITGDQFVIAGNPVNFDALKSYLPGYKVLLYTWDFGDGGIANGEVVRHAFREKGEYPVKLGANAKDISTGEMHQLCVSLKITVALNIAELAQLKGKTVNVKEEVPKITDYDHVFISTRYSSLEAMSDKAIFQVEILSSKTRITNKNKVFGSVIPKYTVREIYLPEEKLFTYIIDEGTTFMDLYPAFREAISSGFKNARIRTYIPGDPSEKELWSIKRSYGTSADDYFAINDYKLLPGGLPVLDKLAGFLKANSAIKLEIAAFTDNPGSLVANLALSRNQAMSIVNYLVSKGINRSRLVASGYGNSRPVTSGYSEAGRKRNRRIDFIIINE